MIFDWWNINHQKLCQLEQLDQVVNALSLLRFVVVEGKGSATLRWLASRSFRNIGHLHTYKFELQGKATLKMARALLDLRLPHTALYHSQSDGALARGTAK